MMMGGGGGGAHQNPPPPPPPPPPAPNPLGHRHAVYHFVKNQIDKRKQVLVPKYS